MKERVINALNRVNILLQYVEELELSDSERVIKLKAERYISDATYFLSIGDYFSSFGAIDYAYGLLESIYFLKKKEFPLI